MAGRNRNRNRNSQRDTRFSQRAQTNVELQDQSQVNLLQQQLQDAQRDYLREGQAAQSVWGGGGEAIRDMPRPQFDRIGQEFNTAAGSYSDLFGGTEGMPGAEVDTGNALGLAYGDAAHTMLANLDAREGLARSSASRQMDLAGRYAGDNVIQRMEDAVRGYNDRLGQVRADDPWQVSQEVQTLKDQALQERLARSKMEGDKAFSEWLQGYVGGGGNPGGGGGPGGGGPGGGGPGAGGGQPSFGPGTGGYQGGSVEGREGGTYGRANPIWNYVHGNYRPRDMSGADRRSVRTGLADYFSTHEGDANRTLYPHTGDWEDLNNRRLFRTVRRNVYGSNAPQPELDIPNVSGSGLIWGS